MTTKARKRTAAKSARRSQAVARKTNKSAATVAKKALTKKAIAKKASARKASARRVAARSAGVKKVVANRTTAKKAAARKTVAKKTVAKQTTFERQTVAKKAQQSAAPKNARPPVSKVEQATAQTPEQPAPEVVRSRPTQSAIERIAFSAPKFTVGQSVNFIAAGFGRMRATGRFSIVRLLPSDGDEYQYRIKSAGEAFERVAKESQLDASI